MSFWSNPLGTIKRVVRNPVKAVTKVVKNPANAILGDKIRQSSLYRNVAKPVVKVGSAAAAAYVTGGGSLIATGAGALTSAATGGLTSRGFSGVKDVVLPGVVGYGVGAGARAYAAKGVKALPSIASKANTGSKILARITAKRAGAPIPAVEGATIQTAGGPVNVAHPVVGTVVNPRRVAGPTSGNAEPAKLATNKAVLPALVAATGYLIFS